MFEYCPWPKLADYLDRPRLDSQWVIQVLKHLTQAIGRLHNEGLIHGDLHPDNLLVSEQGEVCILDLGSACKIGQPVQHFHPCSVPRKWQQRRLRRPRWTVTPSRKSHGT